MKILCCVISVLIILGAAAIAQQPQGKTAIGQKIIAALNNENVKWKFHISKAEYGDEVFNLTSGTIKVCIWLDYGENRSKVFLNGERLDNFVSPQEEIEIWKAAVVHRNAWKEERRKKTFDEIQFDRK